ncbi:MAG: undecaprenyl-phosphate glucose phosphotransferase [Gammaproteobacteria bacterium]|nr:undecaprenyl-phosphate glucose phosphotransferase [Gammaproteobacteria bacterium]
MVFVLVGTTQWYIAEIDQNYIVLLLAQVVVFSYLAEGFQLYRNWRASRFSQSLWLVIFTLTISFVVILIALFLLKSGADFSRVIISVWYAVSVVLLVSWRLAVRTLRALQREHGLNIQKTAIIGLTPRGVQLMQEINATPSHGLEIIGFFDDRDASRFPEEFRSKLLGSVNDAVMTAQSGVISRLYICLPLHADKRIQQIVEQLGDTTLDVYLVPDLIFMNLIHGKLSNVGDIDTISVFESPHLGLQNYIKRSFDIVFSALALVALIPVFLMIAVAIKLTSKGPILFRQDRYGLDGKKIGVYKFRSMKVLENSDIVTQATKNDPRVTPVGAFLRKTSLDELPQFVNVLKGQMSVVGPRPHAVAHNEHYRNKVAFYMLRHKVKPGITGWAQINGWRGETDTLEKMQKRVEFDLAYIRNWSLWWDIQIIVKTVFKGFGGKNVY